MVSSAADTGLPTSIRFLYSARTPEDFEFHKELDEIARAQQNITVAYPAPRPRDSEVQWSGRTGGTDAAMVRAAADELEHPLSYLRGTSDPVEGMVALLLNEIAVPEEDIRLERFLG